MDNAIRYDRAGGTTLVRVWRTESGACAEVQDEGAGIPVEEREKVFERFYRVAARDGPEGSGLGLAIVRTLADDGLAHGGQARRRRRKASRPSLEGSSLAADLAAESHDIDGDRA